MARPGAQQAKPLSVASITVVGLAMILTSCGAPSTSAGGKLRVVAAESPWGAVAKAVGGPYVSVVSLISNPNTDPHEYSASAPSAAAVAEASVVVENGLGYDSFMTQLLSTGSTGPRTVVTASQVLGVSGSDANPHLWYAIEKVPQMAEALARAFSQRDPRHRAAYLSQAARFDASLDPIISVIHQIAAKRSGAPVGETERVAGYLLTEAGLDVVSPPGFSMSIESGSSPSAGDTASMTSLLDHRGIDALVYNLQTESPTTQAVRGQASASRIPVVGVTETVEPVGASFASWQLRQVDSLSRALGVAS